MRWRVAVGVVHPGGSRETAGDQGRKGGAQRRRRGPGMPGPGGGWARSRGGRGNSACRWRKVIQQMRWCRSGVGGTWQHMRRDEAGDASQASGRSHARDVGAKGEAVAAAAVEGDMRARQLEAK